MVRITDRPEMTLAVNHGCKARNQYFNEITLCDIFHFSCHILGNAGVCLGSEFYTIPNLANSINQTILCGLEHIPDFRLRPIIHILVKSLLHKPLGVEQIRCIHVRGVFQK